MGWAVMRSPWVNSRASILRERGFSMKRWTARRKGRAPKVSVVALAGEPVAGGVG